MKIWKKLSLALCLCFVFSSVATACGGGEDSSSSSEEQSSVNDSSSGEEVDDSMIADIYLGLMTSTLTSSKSAKISFEVVNEELLQTGIIESSTEWKMLSGTAVINKTGEKSFDAKIDLTVTSMKEALQPEEKTYYYLDGYVYEYFAKTNTYDKYNESLETVLENTVHSLTQGQYTLETLFGALVGGVGMGDMGDFSDLSVGNLGDAFDDSIKIESAVTKNDVGKYSGLWITLDASEKAGELIDFLGTIDEETTYGDLLDYPLSQIDKDLTTQKILDELFLMRNDDVRDAVKKLDDKSKEKTGKGLQENLDLLLKNESVQEMVKSILPEQADDVLKFNIAEFLEKESSIEKKDAFVKYGDLSMDDLAGELTKKIVEIADDLLEAGIDLESMGFDPSNATFSMLLSVAEMILKQPAFENMTEESTLYKLLQEVKALDVTKADGRLDMSVSTGGVESVKITGNIEGNRVKDSSTIVVGASTELLISEFSKNQITIALPEGATLNAIVYGVCAECKQQKESVSYRNEEYGYYCDECLALLANPNA